MLRRLASITACFTLIGCGASGAVRYAQLGDLPSLSKALDDRAKQGSLDDGTMREVAIALIDYDLARLSGDEGLRRVRSFGACAKPLYGALSRAAKGDSEIAAAAAMALVDADLVSHDAFTNAHRDDARPLWRAVAARGLVDQTEATLRTTRARDDDQHVRRAAIEAAGESACASDFALMLEAARKDPDVVVRTSAVRGLGEASQKLAEGSIRADLVDRLSDLWNGAEDPVRGAIARAWSSPPMFAAGGRGRLEQTLGRTHGHVAVETASALFSAGGDGAAMLANLAEDPELAVRVHALRLLDPAIPRHLDALTKAIAPPAEGMPDELEARVVAADRVVGYSPSLGKKLGPEFEKLRVAAKAALVALVAREDLIGTEAAIALANVGAGEGKARLVKDLDVPSIVRFRAASALVRLGQGAEVRKLLASADLDIRDGAACAVLSSPKP